MQPEDVAAYFDVAFGDAEYVTIGGRPLVAAIFDVATEVALGDSLVLAPTLLTPATVQAAEGEVAVIRGVSYRVRHAPLLQPPDGALQRIVLAKV